MKQAVSGKKDRLLRQTGLFLKTGMLTVCTLLLTVRPVHAYIDPSVMTYAIQAVAGIIIALGAFFGIYWRRVRKKLDKRFHLEEKHYTEMETDDLFFEDPGKDGGARRTVPADFRTAEGAVGQKTGAEQRPAVSAEQSRSRKSRFLPACILILAIAFLTAIYAPLELYMGNIHEFWFDIPVLMPALLKLFLLVCAAGFVIYLLGFVIHRKLYRVLLVIGLAGYIGLYIEGNFLASNLPPLDGSPIDWPAYRAYEIRSVIVWIAVAAAVCLLARLLKGRRFDRLVIAVSLILTVMMAVSLTALTVKNDGLQKKDKHIVTSYNELMFSENENLIILLLDAVDARAFLQEWQKTPEFKDTFEDFTFFENTMCVYPYTKHSIPFILTGAWMENQEDFRQFETKAMDDSPLFAALEERDYAIGVYEEDLVYDSEGKYRFENVTDGYSGFTSFTTFVRLEGNLIGFKYAPYPLKKHCVIDTMLFGTLRGTGEYSLFSEYNDALMAELAEPGVTVEEQNCFRFLHMIGAHPPFCYTKDVVRIPEMEGTYYDNLQCCLTLTDRYLKAIKEAGVWDNSAIIIMSDHGYNVDYDSITRIGIGKQNGLLMVKGKNEHHACKIDEAPLSYDDLQTAYQRLLDGASSTEAFDWKEGDERIRRYLFYSYTEDDCLEEYEQSGFAWDTDGMKPTGRVFELSEDWEEDAEDDAQTN